MIPAVVLCSENFFPCLEVFSTAVIPCTARFHIQFYLKHLNQKEKARTALPPPPAAFKSIKQVQEPILGGFGFFSRSINHFRSEEEEAGDDDDVLPGTVVAVFSISCSPHAYFIPKFLIPFDTVNDHGEAKTRIFGKLVSLRSSG